MATLTQTTLAAAVALTDKTIQVSSATGFVVGYGLWVDKEYMTISAINGTVIEVFRNRAGTLSKHASGVAVYVGPPNYFVTKSPTGAALAADVKATPVINIRTGEMFNVASALWVPQADSNSDRLSKTMVSATPGTVRAFTGSIIPYTSQSSGNLVGVRGDVAFQASSTITGGYFYGAQGKVTVGANAVSPTVIAGVYGQLDVTGATLSAGNNAAVQANIYGANSGTWANLQGLYIEHAGGGVINSMIRMFGKATAVFDIETNVHSSMASGTGTITTNAGYIKVLIDGSVRYIGLGSAIG